MAIPDKRKWCEAKAREHTYDETKPRLDPHLDQWDAVTWHFVSRPENWEDEYDNLFDPGKKIRKLLRRYRILSKKVEGRFENFVPEEFPPPPDEGPSGKDRGEPSSPEKDTHKAPRGSVKAGEHGQMYPMIEYHD